MSKPAIRRENAPTNLPQEKEPLYDTATSIRAVSRTPPGTSFHPVGHISLDADNPPTRRLHLPIPEDNLYWIKSLFVSYALQGAGIGRAAMDEVEASAARAPLCARVLMLDTVAKEDQHREEFLAQLPGKPPAVSSADRCDCDQGCVLMTGRCLHRSGMLGGVIGLFTKSWTFTQTSTRTENPWVGRRSS